MINGNDFYRTINLADDKIHTFYITIVFSTAKVSMKSELYGSFIPYLILRLYSAFLLFDSFRGVHTERQRQRQLGSFDASVDAWEWESGTWISKRQAMHPPLPPFACFTTACTMTFLLDAPRYVTTADLLHPEGTSKKPQTIAIF